MHSAPIYLPSPTFALCPCHFPLDQNQIIKKNQASNKTKKQNKNQTKEQTEKERKSLVVEVVMWPFELSLELLLDVLWLSSVRETLQFWNLRFILNPLSRGH